MSGRFAGRRDELIPILQHVQRQLGYLPEETLRKVARFVRVPESSVFAVATFYAQFRLDPAGRRQVLVCRGTACHVRGAPQILKVIEEHLGITEGETTPDGEYSLHTVACIGACGLSPCISLDSQVEARLTPQKVSELFPKGNGNGQRL